MESKEFASTQDQTNGDSATIYEEAKGEESDANKMETPEVAQSLKQEELEGGQHEDGNNGGKLPTPRDLRGNNKVGIVVNGVSNNTENEGPAEEEQL